ncbi:MAG: hypothetical protein JO180_02075 [Gemmatirosa sp.]|nr:hypothetical protein [Gemmatirosa sp.]
MTRVSAGMLAGMLRFEWRYHTRRVTFAVATLALAGAATMLVATAYGPPGVDVNAPYVVMQSLGLLSLFSVFVLTFFCADGALRDVEHGMTELVFSRPIGEGRWLAARFGGALLAATTVMAVAALALMLAPLVVHVEPGQLGAVRPLAYLWALVVIVVPNLVLVGALLFAVAALTRSTLATYVGAVAIYAVYLVTALLVDSPLMAGAAPPTPEGLARAALLDPFGLSAFFEQTRYWTSAERDVRMPALTGHLLLNRVLWLVIATATLAMVRARFTFQTVGRRGARQVPNGDAVAPAAALAYRPVSVAVRGVAWPAFRSAARIELRHLLRGWTFLALLALWAFVAGMEAVAQLGGGEYGSHVLPTTGLLLDAVRLPLLLLGTVTIVYYAAEVAWRERAVGFDPLVDAAPVSSAALYLAKLAALCALPLVMALVGIGVGMIVQLARGSSDLQPALWLSLLWFAGAPLALFAVAALALQALLPNRWLGMLAGLALALAARRGETVGLEHPMLRFGAGPSVSHSDMDGFGPAAASFAAFMGYWGAAALLLACVTWGVWRRGADVRVGARLRALPRQLGRTGTRVAVASVALFVVAAALLFRQTDVVHAWRSRAASEAWSADYERMYRRLENVPQPSVVAVRTDVALYPDARRAEIAGTLVLENREAASIDTVWVVTPRGAARATVAMPEGHVVRDDARFGVHAFALGRPLTPGARTELRFTLSLDRGGVRGDGFAFDVAANGTYLTSAAAAPALGYRPSYELDDPAARRAHGLATAPSSLPPLAAFDTLSPARRNAAWIALDATVSTSIDQTALAPGRLVRAWTGDGRRHFHFASDGLMTPQYAFVSARYAMRRVRHAGVDVEVWYHPAHAANVGRTLAAATRALDVLGARYSAYPHDALRIAEVPAWEPFGGFALPGMIYFPEDRGFLSDPRADDVDLLTRRVAHEVAHQWWGHRLSPADVAGGSTLVETLAKHSEQLVVADAYAPRALAPMLAFDEDRYLAGRAEARDSEPTLMESAGQAYLYYGKGAVVMNGLRDLLGAAAVDRALARLVAVHGGPSGMATTRDLRAVLLAEARGDADRALVDEWLTDRVVYDLRVDSATATPLGGGRFRLVARGTASKSARRGDAEVHRSTNGEAIDVAAYDERGDVLYTGKARVAGDRIEVDVTLAARPASVVVDPFVTRIDRDRTNNRRTVVVH